MSMHDELENDSDFVNCNLEVFDNLDHNYGVGPFFGSMWVFQPHSEETATLENSSPGQCLDFLKR